MAVPATARAFNAYVTFDKFLNIVIMNLLIYKMDL